MAHFSVFSRNGSGHSLWLLSLLLLSLMLGGCPSTGGVEGTESAAKRHARQGRHAEAAETWERLARSATPAERPALYLDASRAWLEAGQIPRALGTLDRVGQRLPADDPAIAMLVAYRSLRDNAPIQALGQLDAVRGNLPERYNGLWHELRGRAYFMAGDASAGVEALVERELWLNDGASIQENRELLWRAVSELGRKGNQLLSNHDASDTTRGWLALARAVAENRDDPYATAAAITDWQNGFGDHAASFVATRLLAPLPAQLDYPGRVAVLLPLAGRLAGTAAAIRDGFLSAYLRDAENPRRPVVRFYDSESLGAETALRAAIEDGSDFIVGPLRKNSVAEVAALPVTPPVLALNFLPDEIPTRSQFYQFSLAPEHEAAGVARRALDEGLYTAIALVPDSDWGSRVLTAFRDALETGGGRLLSEQVYQPGDTDFAAPITTLLNLTESRERHRQVRATTALNFEFTPRRRQDVQFVFVAANAEQGRLIRPAFSYHFAEDLPVFATASIYRDDPQRNGRDLNGVVFADMPWKLEPDAESAAARSTLARVWPERLDRRGQLYAMGFDAYRLIPRLMDNDEQSPLEVPWPGATGVLSMGAGGRIDRALRVAEVQNGAAQVLPPIGESLRLQDLVFQDMDPEPADDTSDDPDDANKDQGN